MSCPSTGYDRLRQEQHTHASNSDVLNERNTKWYVRSREVVVDYDWIRVPGRIFAGKWCKNVRSFFWPSTYNIICSQVSEQFILLSKPDRDREMQTRTKSTPAHFKNSFCSSTQLAEIPRPYYRKLLGVVQTRSNHPTTAAMLAAVSCL